MKEVHTPTDWTSRIVNDPDSLAGKATIRGTRLAVDMVLDYLAAGWTHAELLESFPTLTEEGIRACLAYAAESVRAERVLTLGTY
jgi:uncharacterized protein (DUF433 family)